MFKHRTIRKSSEDRVFQNSSNRIKSSKWEPLQTWNVGIGKVLLANGRQHQPRHACIESGMCAFGKRRRPMACNITAGAARSARHHRSGLKRHRQSGNRYRPRLARINCGMCASGKQLRLNGMLHQPSLAHINRGVRASTG
ncbi:hypothetical protein H5410_014752 [Solanum commersonii]|uniref:Uncharacterized protein n=1 Tax=Solanum commersonii TaxID=4109 RepID=A0A9J5ZRY0_SOLCO|nr:hypothetical protein H5410_014752 [Solanum commersonii]